MGKYGSYERILTVATGACLRTGLDMVIYEYRHGHFTFTTAARFLWLDGVDAADRVTCGEWQQ